MLKPLKPFGEALATGPNRIALSTALRGTIATVVPLFLLPPLGLGGLAYPAVIGALNTSLVDVGGPYRSRLAVMALLAVIGPSLLFAGTQLFALWGLAAGVMFVVALASGLFRAVGAGGASLGVNTALAFLVGLEVGKGGGDPTAWAGGYLAGALWTILVTLVFWQLRPYRRLEQEVASAWEAVADLVAAARDGGEGASVVARRRREQARDARHRTAREMVEQARAALGVTRAGTLGPGTTVAQLVVLLNAAARIGAAAVTLGEFEARGAGAAATRALRRDAGVELERACRAVARILLDARGEAALAAVREKVAALTALAAAPDGKPGTSAEVLAFAQALRHLDNAEEALKTLFGRRRRLPDLLHLPVAASEPRASAVAAIRAHLTPSSAIFRHAMRVAVITAMDTAIILRFDLPHGIWLPLTSLVILQPNYGGTLSRALQRSAGTIAGAAVAGLLLATLRGSWGYDAAIAVLLFATFLLIRRRYGYGITFLTPLIILLIGLASTDPWLDLAERVVYTIVGAGLALAAGYGLWPQWERRRLPETLARAIRADGDYLAAVLAGLGGRADEPELLTLRREAEIAAGNAGAAFQRMLGEPAHQREGTAGSFTLLIYVQRLCRHGIALALHLGTVALPGEALDELRRLMIEDLRAVADAVLVGRPPPPRPCFDEPLAQLSGAIPDETVVQLLGQLVSDITGLRGAAEPR